MEIMIVIGLISLITAVALPQLIPAITFSTNEGAARRLAGFGRSVVGRAAMMHEKLTVKVDLENQEIWVERWPEPEDEGMGEFEGEYDDSESPFDMFKRARSALHDEETRGEGREYDEDDKAVNRQALRMRRGFERMMRRALIARAERVVHDRESILDEVSPLFDTPFSLELEEEEPEPEELLDPLLARSGFPESISIDSLRIGEEEFFTGVVEIEISSLGLTEAIVFTLITDDDEYYTVEWDPITGGAHMRPGRESAL